MFVWHLNSLEDLYGERFLFVLQAKACTKPTRAPALPIRSAMRAATSTCMRPTAITIASAVTGPRLSSATCWRPAPSSTPANPTPRPARAVCTTPTPRRSTWTTPTTSTEMRRAITTARAVGGAIEIAIGPETEIGTEIGTGIVPSPRDTTTAVPASRNCLPRPATSSPMNSPK